MKRILIVGVSSTVGLKLAQNYLGLGCSVTGTYHSSPPDLPGAELYQLDLTSNAAFISFTNFLRLQKHFDRVIYVAGILKAFPIQNYDCDSIDQVLSVNLAGVGKVLSAVINNICSGGDILLLTSIAADAGSYDPIYSASKSGLTGIIKSLARGATRQIRVNGVSPGLIKDTRMYFAMSASNISKHLDETPLGNLIDLDDLVKIIIELGDEKWKGMNGVNLMLNGGRYV